MFRDNMGAGGDGELLIGGKSVVELADQYETPLYVVDEARIREKYRRFCEAFSEYGREVTVHYAYKANSNLAVCKVLQDSGCGADVGSLCELEIALKVGIPGEKIVLNGNNKSEEEIELAIQNGVLINVDNLRELEIVNRRSAELGEMARIGFRVNPDIEAPTHPHISTGLRESKFGLDVPSGRALEAYSKAKEAENVSVESIHSHIGSQILDPQPFAEQARKSMELRAEIERETGVVIETINLGGGLGVPYRPGQKGLPAEKYGSETVSAIEGAHEAQDLPKPKLAFEPGRFLVADSSVLIGRVGYVKKRVGSPDWISLDVGMNALIRPALYDSYHHIEVANKMKREKTGEYNIAGPLCESGDYLGKGRELPPVERGDVLAVYDVGAYGLAMSSQYNAKPRPAAVMIGSEGVELIREREKCDDVISSDNIPEWFN